MSLITKGQNEFACGKGTRRTHTKAESENCALGASLAFPRTSRHKKVDLEMTTIVSLFCTFCAHLYQFIADVYIFNSLAERSACTSAGWDLCLHSAGFFEILKMIKHLLPPTVTNWPLRSEKEATSIIISPPDGFLSLIQQSSLLLLLLIFLLCFLRNGVQDARLRGGSTTKIWTLK